MRAMSVLLVEDDPDTARLNRRALEAAGMTVRHAGDVDSALREVRDTRFDVVVSDQMLPDGTGTGLAEWLSASLRPVPVVVTTAHVTADIAVLALRSHVREFLPKPVSAPVLVDAVHRVAHDGPSSTGKVVLAIGAHPDDLEIGAGGTLLAHRDAGDEIVLLTMSRGARGGEAERRAEESRRAAALLGARLVHEDLDDTRIPEGGATIALIERLVGDVRPDIVYTHAAQDRHQDHRAVHNATMVASRSVPVVACYQSPSATIEFQPSRFVDIERQLEEKLELIRCFESQSTTRGYLRDEVIRAAAVYWARFGAAGACEPFVVVRDRAPIASPAMRAAAAPVPRSLLAR